MQTSSSLPIMQHPCNRFGYGYAAAASSGQAHPGHPVHPSHPVQNNYGQMNAIKPTNPWPVQQFNFRAGGGAATAASMSTAPRDSPLTPPADRTDPAANANSNVTGYYSMLPPMSTNNNLMVNYSQSPVEKAMTPPQDNQDNRIGLVLISIITKIRWLITFNKIVYSFIMWYKCC